MVEKLNRFDYVKYDELSEHKQEAIKKLFIGLCEVIEVCLEPGREKALVFTKLEEAYMWIGKSLRNSQVARNGTFTLQEERKDG